MKPLPLADEVDFESWVDLTSEGGGVALGGGGASSLGTVSWLQLQNICTISSNF